MSGDEQDVERDIRAYAARSYGQPVEERPAAMIRWLLTVLDDERRRYNEVAQEAEETEQMEALLERLAAGADTIAIEPGEPWAIALENQEGSASAMGPTLAEAVRALAAQIERATLEQDAQEGKRVMPTDLDAAVARLDAQASWFSVSFEKNRPDDVGTARRPYEIDTELGRDGKSGRAFSVQGETLREAVQALAAQIERAVP